MKFLVKAELPLDKGNQIIANGNLPTVMSNVLETLKPEASYFLAENGNRTAYLFVNCENGWDIPAIAEPLFFALNAKVTFTPVMTVQDLQKADTAINTAVKNFA